MNQLTYYVYARSFHSVFIVALLTITIWTMLSRLVEKKTLCFNVFRYVNLSLFFIEILIVIYITIGIRTMRECEVFFIPFYSLVLARKEPEMYRSMLMNILLFIPWGLTMPYVLRKCCNRKIIKTILCAMIFSVSIEVVQYIFCIGRAEVDDIMCNTLGAAIGCVSYWTSDVMQNFKKRK